MSEEFIRCSECGNLNIQGSTRCVFCNAKIEKAEPIPIEEKITQIPETPSVGGIPTPETKTAEFDKALPKIPDIVLPEEKPKKKDIDEIDNLEKQYTFVRKFFMISLYSILIAIIHYFLNLLVSVISIKIENNNVNAFPIPADLNQFIAINAVSFILGIPFAIVIGYIMGKLIRRFNSKKSSLIKWFSYAILLDLILNAVIAIGLIFAFDTLNEKDILFLMLAGAAFIFIMTSIITLFIPMISGSFLIFNKLDKMLFPKKYVEY